MNRTRLLLASIALLLEILYARASWRSLGYYVAVDFRAAYTTAKIAVAEGITHAGDRASQDREQRVLYESLIDPERRSHYPYVFIPVPYPPVFTLPWVLAAPFSFATGYLVFTAFRAIGFAAVAFRLLWVLRPREPRATAVAIFLASFGVYFTLLLGQHTLWLTFCVAESTLAAKRDRPFQMGCWLSGLFLRPQLVLLLVPCLLLARRFRALAGFASGMALVLLSSWAFVGTRGMKDWIDILRGYGSHGLAHPESMMNWRAIAVALGGGVPGWTVAALGTLVVLAVVVRSWLVSARKGNPVTIERLLGTLAATLVVSPHSHVHTAASLLPLLLAAEGSVRFPRGFFDLYALAPLAVFFLNAALANVGLAHMALGLFAFAFSLLVIALAFRNHVAASA